MPSTVLRSEIREPLSEVPSSNEGENGFLHPQITATRRNSGINTFLIHPPFQFAPVCVVPVFRILPVINAPY
jgi:hypothetical protein